MKWVWRPIARGGEQRPTNTVTATPTKTSTAVPTNTATATPTKTSTAVPTNTATATPTKISTAVPTNTATATPEPSPGQCAGAISGNAIQNPSFENGTTLWSFYSNAQTGGFTTTTSSPFDCARSAQIAIQNKGSNVQLYQAGISLQPNTPYRLSLVARSSTGRDIKAFLQMHTSPYTSFGLNGVNLNLTPNWQTFTIEFTTTGFTSPTNNGRLRFSMDESNIAGEVYYLDLISLVPLSSGPQPTPTQTPSSPTPTSTPGSPPGTNFELVAFEWNKLLTTADHGFALVAPPKENGNWITPINFAEGTFYYRAEIRSMPTNKDLNLQYCIWQEKNGDNFGLENCGSQQTISYKGSVVVSTWSEGVQDLWKKNGQIIEWDRPRYRDGVAVKTTAGVPVSDYNGWNWNGQNPAHWYPMNLRFTVVVVAKGHTFSGWANYP